MSNVRPCSDEISGVNGKPHRCTLLGDMPIIAVKDRDGNVVRMVLKNVRCVPIFSESLLSVSNFGTPPALSATSARTMMSSHRRGRTDNATTCPSPVKPVCTCCA
eukprot:433344-Pleurochrysis_carterae.AAC.3